MKKNKDFKFNYHYEKQHGIYAILGLIIIFLSIFMINNFSKCKVYSLSTSDTTYRIENGVLALTNQKSMLKMSKIDYTGDIVNVASVSLTLCVEIDNKCSEILIMGSNAAEGMNLPSYLEKVSFDINEHENETIAFSKEERKNIVDNLYLKLDIVTLDGEVYNELIKINVDLQYANNKLFY